MHSLFKECHEFILVGDILSVEAEDSSEDGSNLSANLLVGGECIVQVAHVDLVFAPEEHLGQFVQVAQQGEHVVLESLVDLFKGGTILESPLAEFVGKFVKIASLVESVG